MEEQKDEEDQRLDEQKEVWTTENDNNGNEMNLSSELTDNHCTAPNIFYSEHFW